MDQRNKNILLDSSMYEIIDPKKSKAHFLAEFLNSEIGQFEIAKFSQGMGIVKSIRSKDLALINVYLPPIDHQEKITAEFGQRK